MKKKSTRLAPTSCLWQQGFRGALQRLTITLIGTMVGPFLVAHQMAERKVETHNVKVIVITLALNPWQS